MLHFFFPELNVSRRWLQSNEIVKNYSGISAEEDYP
jgi:hypothetical protein